MKLGYAAAILALSAAPALAQTALAQTTSAGDATHGQYVFNAGGCASCHTDTPNKGPVLGGGVALKTKYGTFYTPNITPDPTHGIGKWTEADLHRALHEGKAPDGSDYFPAFPYTSYTGMTDQDIADLWAYLRTIPPSDHPSKPHELKFPYGFRTGVMVWKALYFHPGQTEVKAGQPAEVARGAYLVSVLSHCGECHSPRGVLGNIDRDQWLAGTDDSPTGGTVPNITPDKKFGIGGWTDDQILGVLTDGSTPDFDYVGGDMAEEVDNSTSKLTDADRKAIVAYLHSVPAVAHEVKKKEAAK